DGIGCAIRGLDMEAGELILRYAEEIEEGKPEATIWGRDMRVPARLAGLVNATSAHVPNIGNSFNIHPLHVNYLMPQAAIAVAEKERLSGRDVIVACVAGTEVCLRAALATHVSDEGGYFNSDGRGWQSTGALGAIGTSVAAGKLLCLDAERMVQALVLGGTQLTGVYRPSGSYMGKALFAGKAVAGGIENGYIALQGFVAGFKLYEDGLCFGSGIISPVHDLQAASQGLGETWHSLNVDFCIHPAKKTFNANIDSLLHILRTENLGFEDIDKVTLVSAYTKVHAHGVFTKPANSTEAFNNLHYIAAATVHDGDYWFDQLEKEKYENPEILDFAQHNVAMVGDAELEKLTAKSWPGAAEIIAKDGRQYYKCFEAHKGEISNPLTKGELQAKFRRMTPILNSESVDSVIGMVDRLEELDDLTELTALLNSLV
ncbi:MAG: MmgE/PrpD family protein, partial [Pirellulaceae bacterium]